MDLKVGDLVSHNRGYGGVGIIKEIRDSHHPYCVYWPQEHSMCFKEIWHKKKDIKKILDNS